jgi:hypothetical protein
MNCLLESNALALEVGVQRFSFGRFGVQRFSFGRFGVQRFSFGRFGVQRFSFGRFFHLNIYTQHGNKLNFLEFEVKVFSSKKL